MKEYLTKVCPRCGEELFDDMDVCYGCLYEFPKENAEKESVAQAVELPIDDEIPSLAEEEPFKWDQGMAPAEFDWEDDTLDLSLACEAAGRATGQPLALFRTPSMDVSLPIPKAGMSIGRGPDNDVILHSRAVSRSHVRLFVRDGAVIAQDMGATNPALYRGREVGEGTQIPFGGTISVCGTFVTVISARRLPLRGDSANG